MSTLLVVGLVVVAVALLAGRKTVSRIFAAIGGQLNKLGRLVWGFDPVAVYQKQVDDATEEIKAGTKGLEQYRGLVSRLQRQVEAGTKETAVWQARAEGYVKQGNDAKATEALAEKKKVEATLAENQGQLNAYEQAYQGNLKKIQYAQKKIEEAKREAQRLQADLRMSQAEAEIAKLASSFNVKTNSLDSLGEVREEIQRQIDSNRAKAQVARDLGTDGLADIEAEEAARTAEASNDLAALKAKMGVGGGSCSTGSCPTNN